jgi:hypothetical protein
MGWLDQLTDMLGERLSVQRFAREQAHFEDPQSPDFERWNQLIGTAPREDVEEAVTHAARRVDPQEYYEHITPGVRGTDPLGELGGGALGRLASSLIGNLMGRSGIDARRLPQQVPGLHTTDPQQMSPQEVASLANYLRQHHPEAFGRTAAELGQQEPGLLQHLLGNKALMLAAAGLAAKFLADLARNR